MQPWLSSTIGFTRELISGLLRNLGLSYKNHVVQRSNGSCYLELYLRLSDPQGEGGVHEEVSLGRVEWCCSSLQQPDSRRDGQVSAATPLEA